MSFSQLSTLTPKDKLKTICVKVSRKWEFRGLNDDGPLQHVDLVLVDDQVAHLCTSDYYFRTMPSFDFLNTVTL